MLASNRGRKALRAVSSIQAEAQVEMPRPSGVTAFRKPIPFGPSVLPQRIARYLANNKVPSPCVIVDLSIVERQYVDIAKAFPKARVFYAIKANPDDAILASLAKLGSYFDAASIGE